MKGNRKKSRWRRARKELRIRIQWVWKQISLYTFAADVVDCEWKNKILEHWNLQVFFIGKCFLSFKFEFPSNFASSTLIDEHIYVKCQGKKAIHVFQWRSHTWCMYRIRRNLITHSTHTYFRKKIGFHITKCGLMFRNFSLDFFSWNQILRIFKCAGVNALVFFGKWKAEHDSSILVALQYIRKAMYDFWYPLYEFERWVGIARPLIPRIGKSFTSAIFLSRKLSDKKFEEFWSYGESTWI